MKYKLIITNFLLSKYWARTISIPFINFSYILVRPTKAYDIALINHELVHVKQHYANKYLHVFKYFIFIDYRYKCELEAYAVQLAALYLINRDDNIIKYALKSFSEFLMDNYFLYNIDWENMELIKFDLNKIERDLTIEYKMQLKKYDSISKLPYKNWLI